MDLSIIDNRPKLNRHFINSGIRSNFLNLNYHLFKSVDFEVLMND